MAAMPYSPEQMQQAENIRREKSLHLRTQNLMIGEDHSWPHGRGLAGNLINDGVVRKLFLEFPDSAITVEGESMRLGAHLRKLAQHGGNLSHQELEATWDSVRNFEGLEESHGNAASLKNLMKIAVFRGVEVHLMDKPNFASLQVKEYLGDFPSRNKGMAARNWYMSAYVDAHTKEPADQMGNLVITGSMHVEAFTDEVTALSPKYGSWEAVQSLEPAVA